MMVRPTIKEIARFIDGIQITKHCWLWIGWLDRDGYGAFRFREIPKMLAHRFSYELFVGPITSGKQILHRRGCGNRNCVNPNHLYLGTNADNMRDRDIWGNTAKGERSGLSKLSEIDVLAVRRTHKIGNYSFQNISDMFGISKSQAYRIVSGQNWKHLPL